MDINQGYQITEIEKLNFNKLKVHHPNKKYEYIFLLILLLNLISISINLNIYIKKNKLINNFLKYNQESINETHIVDKLNLIEKNQYLQIDKLDYLSEKQNNFDLINIFRPMDVFEKKKIRIGRNNDGGYILLDDFKDIKIAYSFGIGKEISFDKDLADKNIDIFMYDHTIKRLPFENQKFHWKKIGLSSHNLNQTNMKTLNDLIVENGHLNQQNMILKLDIESNEWDVFQELPIKIMRQFKYIVGEFHFTHKNRYKYLNILKKIEITHQIFHLHCNNCASFILNYYGYNICSLLEISFVLKEGYKFEKFNSTFPINGIDYKNCEKMVDFSYLLNTFV